MTKKRERANTATVSPEAQEQNISDSSTCAPGDHEWETWTTDWSKCRLCSHKSLTKYLET